jgi:hypothetical protein
MIGLNIRARSSSSLSLPLRNGQFQLRDLCRTAFAALLLIAGVKLIKLNLAQKLSKLAAGLHRRKLTPALYAQLTAFLYDVITMIFEVEYI